MYRQLLSRAMLGARTCAALVLFASAGAAHAQGDAIFRNSMEAVDVPQSEAEASRFLQQATFGPTKAEITSLASSPIGLSAWMDQQFGILPTYSRPFIENRARLAHDANQNINQDDRLHRWFDVAVRAPDQLRQRMAYALSQIIVVSDRADALSGEPVMMAEWNDLLVRNAFGNYRDLLREATYSPMMGLYLTSLRNRKFELQPTCLNAAGNGNTDCNNDNAAPFTITAYQANNNAAQPDENYAREVMQLFSIGLIDRELDFSPSDVSGSPGLQTQATYDQQMITTLSRALTGLSYQCSGNATVEGVAVNRSCGTGCTGDDCRYVNASGLFFTSPPRGRLPNNMGDSSLLHPDYYRPMVCYPRYHDNGRDMRRFQMPGPTAGSTAIANTTLSLGSGSIPAGTPDADKALVLSGATLATLEEFRPGASKETVPDCNATGNGALTSLTAAQRAECITQCDNDVQVAIDLLFNHPNTAPMVARQLIQRFTSSNPSAAYVQRVAAKFENNGQGVRGDLKAVLKAVLLDPEARLATNAPNFAESGKLREPMLKLVQVWRTFGAVPADGRRWGVTNPQNQFLQRPLGAPSVFNFYEPDFQQPGNVAAEGLYSPEFQIINENSAMLAANELFSRICTGYGGGNNNCSGAFTQPANTSDRAYIPPAVLDALPSGDAAMIEELNVRLMGGLMSGSTGSGCGNGSSGMKGTLLCLLQSGLAGTLGDTSANGALNAKRRKALYLTHLIAISPEFALQR